jgi:ubiquinone/menaquinone biosynthesis C-methylase UbiE
MSAPVQGAHWSADPRGWAEVSEVRNRPLYERVLERLDPRPGTTLLDAGCGAGLFAATAAERGAVVTGLDAAAGLVEYASTRRPTARFVVGDLEALPFGDGAFDVVTAFNSVLYADAPRRALAEIARVTTPSGWAVVTVGAGPEQGECAGLIEPLAPRDALPDRSSLDLADAAAARAALLEAGFASVDVTEVGFELAFAGVEDAIAAQLPAGPVAAAVRHSGRAAVEAALRRFFEPRVRPDGTARMRVAFRCFFAQR